MFAGFLTGCGIRPGIHRTVLRRLTVAATSREYARTHEGAQAREYWNAYWRWVHMPSLAPQFGQMYGRRAAPTVVERCGLRHVLACTA